MKLLRHARELDRGPRKASLAIGVFDGVHLGHQQVIRQAVADARQHEGLAVVVTFDAHPNTVVARQHVPPLLQTNPQKLRAIATLGVDATLLLHFDHALSQQPAEEFIRSLARDLGPLASLCVGGDFTFGHQRGGNVALLNKLGDELGFTVHGLASVALNNEPVSSTRIREAVRHGDFDTAGQMLGRTFSLAGEIVRGDARGRELGFPTANLDVTGLVLPPNGVYAAHATVAGRTHRAAVNIGLRPTLASPAPRLMVEAHLLDFSGDLYGQEMELTFVENLRDEQRFANLDELKQQIASDTARAREIFARL